jgi:hypothetical protein
MAERLLDQTIEGMAQELAVGEGIGEIHADADGFRDLATDNRIADPPGRETPGATSFPAELRHYGRFGESGELAQGSQAEAEEPVSGIGAECQHGERLRGKKLQALFVSDDDWFAWFRPAGRYPGGEFPPPPPQAGRRVLYRPRYHSELALG